MRHLASLLLLAAAPPYLYFALGSSQAVTFKPTPAFALIGGGEDVDEISRWFVSKAGGGDLLVVRAAGNDAYNPYFFKLAPLNSAQTLIIPSAEAAQNPFVASKISHAEAIFIAGGDQWNYMNLWNHSSLGDALRLAVQRGVPLGGTSAGLAVMGEYIFTAEKDTITSAEALSNPYGERVKIAHNFLNIPALRNVITDSHFKARDRMGRTLVFLARILQDFHLHEAHAIAIDERTAALLEPNGDLRVAGQSNIYFISAARTPEVCRSGVPLTMSGVSVYRAPQGSHFNTVSWTGSGGYNYQLAIHNGIVTSNQSDHAIY